MKTILAPLRISLIGGGTDYESFYKYYPGRVISFACDKSVSLTIGSFFEIDKFQFKRKILLDSAGKEVFNNLSPMETLYVRQAINRFMASGNFGITCNSDLMFNEMGLGWSGSFLVALFSALLSFENKHWGQKEILTEAYNLEHQIMKEPGGKQDHCAAVWGGFNFFEFNENGSVNRKKIEFSEERLKNFTDHLMFFDSGIREVSSKVLREQQAKIPSCFRQLRMLSDMVLEFYCELERGSFESCGVLLHEAWELKKKFSSSISNNKIDDIYDRARKAGALGGKIMGPGGGGCLLLMVRPQDRDKIRAALYDLREMGFSLEPNGARVLE